MKLIRPIINAAAYSLLIALCAIVTSNWKISLLLWGVFFIECLILFIGNDHANKYFWTWDFNYLFPKWSKTGDVWIIVLGIILMSTGLVMFRMYLEDPDFGVPLYLIIPQGIVGAFLARYGYLKNAPKDPIAYEEAKKKEEYDDTYVVVAEVKDGSSAHIIKDHLEANGIKVLIYGENLPDYLGGGNDMMPVRVLVRRKDKEKAETIINE